MICFDYAEAILWGIIIIGSFASLIMYYQFIWLIKQGEMTAKGMALAEMGEVNRTALGRGYVLADLWTTKDVERIAEGIGYILLDTEVVEVVKIAKEQFNTEDGMNAEIIRESIEIWALTKRKF